MTVPSRPAELPDAADQAAEDAAYYRRVLHDLIEIGADMARIVQQQAKAGADAASAGAGGAADAGADVTVAFDRIARAMRRTIALARVVAEPVAARGGDGERARQRVAARKRIIRKVEDAIDRKAEDAEDEARLHGALVERLDAADLDDDIGDQPVDAIIKDICRDLGLDDSELRLPWKRRSAADIATLHARAAAPAGAAGSVVALPDCGGGERWTRPAAGPDLAAVSDEQLARMMLSSARFRGK